MLTGLKMSFLVVCKCVFYRQEHNAKVGPHGTELECKNGIYQQIEVKEEMRKNWVISPVIMFTVRVMVIKMTKMAHFLYFLLMTAKKIITVWTKYLNASERS